MTASFTTAPAKDTAAAVRFIVGGDVGGHDFCRRAEGGYAVFREMAALEPHFFIANSDMIYADGEYSGPLPGDQRPTGRLD